MHANVRAKMCLVVELAEKGKLVHAKQKSALAFEKLPKLELQICLFLESAMLARVNLTSGSSCGEDSNSPAGGFRAF